MVHLVRATAAALALAPMCVAAQTTSPPIWRVASDVPLQVWIQSVPAASGSQNVHAVRLALAEWNAQRLPVRMELGADSLTAHIHVLWRDRFDEPINGRTTCVDDGAKRLVSAEVMLALRHSDGRVLSDEETRVLALHELGHALGLDHSADSTSVMQATVRVRAISAADRARVIQLYGAR